MYVCVYIYTHLFLAQESAVPPRMDLGSTGGVEDSSD